MQSLTKAILLSAAIAAALSCSPKGDSPRYRMGIASINRTVHGLTMKSVEASCFTFNAANTGRPIEGSPGTVQVFQSAFWISEVPIDDGFWADVMGKPGLRSYDDAERFLDKLYRKTGIPFIIPSEAMLEAALWQHAIVIDGPVLTSDTWNEDAIPNELSTDWRYTEKGNSNKVVRKRYERYGVERFRKTSANRFFIAVRSNSGIPDQLKMEFSPEMKPARQVPVFCMEKRTFTVAGESFAMIPVEGGQATLGGTREQEKYAEGDEVPVVETTLQDFMIGETEVTAGLWEAVMGYLPNWNDRKHPERPVVGVSWYDAKEFIHRLNGFTGERFRLPDEYEWEYAARGGRKSRGYVLAGGNPPAEIGVFSSEKDRAKLSSVKTKKPNELGLYDMSGNAWEWVQGQYVDGNCVLRGGSYAARSAACRVSNRQGMPPGQIKDSFGFRLAL